MCVESDLFLQYVVPYLHIKKFCNVKLLSANYVKWLALYNNFRDLSYIKLMINKNGSFIVNTTVMEKINEE